MRVAGHRVPFDMVTIVLHWTTVSLISFQFMTGLSLEFFDHRIPASAFLDIHRSTGTLIWLVSAARLIWRSRFARFPPFPTWMSAVQIWFARHTEHLLYALLLLQPLSGLGMSLMFGRPFHLFFMTVPAMPWANLYYSSCFETVHLVDAYALLTVIGGHAGMALLHHYVFKDDVLEKMAPWVKQRQPRLAPSSTLQVPGSMDGQIVRSRG